ncbi:MAG: riboflavin biosynthesis protein RibF, partial [Planctomycetaceae bacterium]
MAQEVGGPAVVVTFDPPPAAILRPQSVPPQLTTIDRRTALLKQCGVDHVFVCKTDRELLNQSAEEFFSRLVVDELDARGVVEGPNFYFGRNRSGDIQRLRELCQTRGVALAIVDPQSEQSTIISSTRVRQLLREGEVEAANRLLTQPYQIAGRVVRGAARGREIGFPTANLADIKTLVPGEGVYACRARIGEKTMAAATHVGPNPTFAEKANKIEVHLLDFHDDVYDETVEVEFIARVRGVLRFASSSDLSQQLERDIRQVRDRLRGNT